MARDFLFQPMANKNNEFQQQQSLISYNLFLDLGVRSEEIVLYQNLKDQKQITFCVAKKDQDEYLIDILLSRF